MAKLSIFNFLSLNGFYKGENNDISWHKHGGEENEYSKEGANSGNILLFGRVTYEMMASFWPTEMAKQQFPEVATGMNKSEKYVFSKTLKKAEWNNTKIISENIFEEVTKMKMGNRDMTILGSGSIITQLADKNLIDEFQLMVDPVAIPGGKSFLFDIHNKIEMKLTKSKTFKSGVVLLCYEKA